MQFHGNKRGKAEMVPRKGILLREYHFKDRNDLHMFIILGKWLVKKELAGNE